ncbi:hypothetical protein ES703_34872 [subsurface metagenome]
MDYEMRLLAALSELSIDELRLVELFVEWLAERGYYPPLDRHKILLDNG